MIKLSFPVLIIVLLYLGSCSLISERKSDYLDYSTVSYEFQTPDCEPERDVCLMIKLQYPDFDIGDSLAQVLANRIVINSSLDLLGAGDVEANEVAAFDKAIDNLDKSLQKMKQEVGSAAGWMAEIDCKELYRNDSILVLETNAMTYFGGAHGNYSTRHLNFDRRTGQLIPLSHFVELKSFIYDAESTFRMKYVKEDQNYAEAGFSFFGGKYVLSANYAYLGDSILLHYNPYEIAPYTAGQFEIKVPIK